MIIKKRYASFYNAGFSDDVIIEYSPLVITTYVTIKAAIKDNSEAAIYNLKGSILLPFCLAISLLFLLIYRKVNDRITINILLKTDIL